MVEVSSTPGSRLRQRGIRSKKAHSSRKNPEDPRCLQWVRIASPPMVSRIVQALRFWPALTRLIASYRVLRELSKKAKGLPLGSHRFVLALDGGPVKHAHHQVLWRSAGNECERVPRLGVPRFTEEIPIYYLSRIGTNSLFWLSGPERLEL